MILWRRAEGVTFSDVNGPAKTSVAFRFLLNIYIKQRLNNHSSRESLSEQIIEIVLSIHESEYKKKFNLMRLSDWEY